MEAHGPTPAWISRPPRRMIGLRSVTALGIASLLGTEVFNHQRIPSSRRLREVCGFVHSTLL